MIDSYRLMNTSWSIYVKVLKIIPNFLLAVLPLEVM